MVVLYGDEVQGNPIKNCILENPHNICSMDNNYLVAKL